MISKEELPTRNVKMLQNRNHEFYCVVSNSLYSSANALNSANMAE